ncbi:MAG: hypothetical protein ABSE46_14020 [Terracidiphilus sp.]|jgi:hypothetical protein
MSAKVIQMGTPKSAYVENFIRRVETVEAGVNFTIGTIANEDGSNRMCEIDLVNPEGTRERLCKGLLSAENVESLIDALNAWMELP